MANTNSNSHSNTHYCH